MPYLMQDVSPHFSCLSEGHLVAVNVFGEPFFELQGTLIKVSPETGDREIVGPVEKFSFDALDDYWTGASVKAAWEEVHGPVGDQHFLIPQTPFVLGGEFNIENLDRVPIQAAADFYRVIRDQVSSTPDGGKIRIEVGQ